MNLAMWLFGVRFPWPRAAICPSAPRNIYVMLAVALPGLTRATPVLTSIVPESVRPGAAAWERKSINNRADFGGCDAGTPASLTTTLFWLTLKTAVPEGAL